MIVGTILLLRKDTQEYIDAHICSDKKEQDLDVRVYFIEIPLIAKALESHNSGLSTFELNKHDYEIIDINFSRSENAEPTTENIYIDSNAVIHLVTKNAFEGIHFCCPSCRTTNKDNIQIINAEIECLSDSNKFLKLSGVLNCKNCKYYYADKLLFNNFLKDHNFDVAVPRQEIEVKNNKIALSDTWHGAPDSVLSRYGYSADGNTPKYIRHRIIEYLIARNIATYYNVQHLLSGFIFGREERNQNAAKIWKDDLEWLNTRYGNSKTIRGIISQF